MPQPQSEFPLSSQIDAFLESLTARQYSPATVSTYAIDLRHLLAILGEVSPGAVSPQDIRSALAALHRRGYRPRTLARTLPAWRSFFKYLAWQGVVQANPCMGIRPPKGEQKLPNALSVRDMAQLLDGPVETEEEMRDQAVFELMYSSGLRRAEIINLDVWDIDCAEREVRVRGKGGRERILPVGRTAIAAIRQWLHVRHTWSSKTATKTTALFLGKRGGRLPASAVLSGLKNMAKRRGVTAKVHPHALRHSFASHMLQNSRDIRAVQEMLGHVNISTTQIYTHIDIKRLTEAYQQAHPRARRRT